jgi:hypothetical protein
MIGRAVSRGAALTVLNSPAIAVQPQSLTVPVGTTVLLTVSALGKAPLSYQWYADCTRPISGATSSTLRLKRVTLADSGSYCVGISNAYGSVLSQPAVLRVVLSPGLVSLIQKDGLVTLTFSTVAGLFYTVYYSDDLASGAWILLPNASRQLGTGAPMAVQDMEPASTHRFYRIVLE